MIPRDHVRSPSTARRSATTADSSTERATPQPTVLSTVWEGPSDDDSPAAVDGHPRTLDLETSVVPSWLFRWLNAPATRRRVLIITTVVAVVCGVVLAVGDVDEPAPELATAPANESSESTHGSLSSRAVAGAADRQLETNDEQEGALAGRSSTEPDPSPREAVSADERIRLTVDPVQTAAGGWLLEVQVVDTAESAPTVRFTVNGAVVEEVERAPYRLLLNAEVIASSSSAVGEGQPLIVTASALWPGSGDASPATIVLSD